MNARAGVDAVARSRADANADTETACVECRRRAWLLGELSAILDYRRADRDRLLAALALEDGALVAALAGRRREHLATRLTGAEDREWSPSAGARSICRHDNSYPPGLSEPDSPHALFHSGGRENLLRLCAAPIVAILGAARASDYGREVAAGLGRGLARARVTVAASARGEIANTALEAAAGAGAGVLVIAGNGLGAIGAGGDRELLRRLGERACAVSELPAAANGRGWGAIAAERILVGLAAAVVLVEGRESSGALAAARLARSRARPLGGVPGWVTSPLAAGPHALLREGAHLIDGPVAVLDLLHGTPDPRPGSGQAGGVESMQLHADPMKPLARSVLDLVASGSGTLPEICAGGIARADALAALGELELGGSVIRGSGGRYFAHM